MVPARSYRRRSRHRSEILSTPPNPARPLCYRQATRSTTTGAIHEFTSHAHLRFNVGCCLPTTRRSSPSLKRYTSILRCRYRGTSASAIMTAKAASTPCWATPSGRRPCGAFPKGTTTWTTVSTTRRLCASSCSTRATSCVARSRPSSRTFGAHPTWTPRHRLRPAAGSTNGWRTCSGWTHPKPSEATRTNCPRCGPSWSGTGPCTALLATATPPNSSRTSSRFWKSTTSMRISTDTTTPCSTCGKGRFSTSPLAPAGMRCMISSHGRARIRSSSMSTRPTDSCGYRSPTTRSGSSLSTARPPRSCIRRTCLTECITILNGEPPVRCNVSGENARSAIMARQACALR
ncbi:hypothetical protein H310_08894, partial [Aphanomyces invadans]